MREALDKTRGERGTCNAQREVHRRRESLVPQFRVLASKPEFSSSLDSIHVTNRRRREFFRVAPRPVAVASPVTRLDIPKVCSVVESVFEGVFVPRFSVAAWRERRSSESERELHDSCAGYSFPGSCILVESRWNVPERVKI